MAEVVEMPNIDELLQSEITRERFQELRKAVHSSGENYRSLERRMSELIEQARSASGSAKKEQLLRVGAVLTAMGRYEKAQEVLDEVSDQKEAKYYLALIAMRQEHYEEAIGLLKTGFSDDVDAQAMLAELYIITGQLEEAEGVMKKAELAKAETPQGLYLQGRLTEANGGYREAMDLYKEVIEQEPDHVSAMFRLAFNYDLNGQDEKAIELYERASTVSPTDASVLVNLGVLYEDQDLYYEAVECYKRILAIEPNHPRVKMFLKDARASLTMWVDEEELKKMRQEDEVLKIPVSDFELSVRSRNCLERMGISTLGDLTRVSEPDLLAFKNFGETSLQEIRGMLAQKGLRLGQTLEEAEEEGTEAERSQREMENKLNSSISQLDLSTRARRCMERLGIATVGELIEYTEEELLAMPNFGRTSVNELKEKLAELGLELKKKQ